MSNVAWDFSNENETFDLFNSEMDFVVRNLSQAPRKLAVAVSGGSDSMALLLLLRKWSDSRNCLLTCVTVDHKLRSESREEALFVRDFCTEIGVPHIILEWTKDSNELPHGKIEDLARNARYNLISNFCERKSINIVAVGHTWNDQLETYEMRKSQKSSDLGLAGMSRIHSISKDVKLVRPIMIFTKEHLKKFLCSKKIKWKDDPMNDDVRFKRVFCRKDILDFDKDQLFRKTSEIKSLGRKRREIEKYAVSFLEENMNFSNAEFGYTTFDLSEFLQQNISVQSEILKRTIWDIGGKKYAMKVDEEVLKKIFAKEIKTLGRCLVKVTKKQIAVFRENRNLNQIISVEKNGSFLFDNRFLVSIKNCKFHNGLTKCVILSRRSFGNIHDEDSNAQKLPKAVLCSLPCVCMNDRLLFAYGSSRSYLSEKASIKCDFVHKVNLFDIFF